MGSVWRRWKVKGARENELPESFELSGSWEISENLDESSVASIGQTLSDQFERAG